MSAVTSNGPRSRRPAVTSPVASDGRTVRWPSSSTVRKRRWRRPSPGVTEAVRRPFTSVRTVTRSPVIRRTVAPPSAAGAAARAGAVGPPGPAATGVTAPADRVSPAATAAATRMRRLTPVPFVGRVVHTSRRPVVHTARGAVGAAQVRSPARAVSPFRRGTGGTCRNGDTGGLTCGATRVRRREVRGRGTRQRPCERLVREVKCHRHPVCCHRGTDTINELSAGWRRVMNAYGGQSLRPRR